MSSNDKTKEKLMESMRMTKAGTDKKNEQVETKNEAAPQVDEPVKKEVKSKPAKKAKKAKKESQNSTNDPFQAMQRVWPD